MRVLCAGYNQDYEKYFTIGKEYEITDRGTLISDEGYEYRRGRISPLDCPNEWELARWYNFEIVDDEPDGKLPKMSFDDFCKGVC